MKISILTCSYNYEQYIEETIKSVLNQTYTDFEYIIFDDGSTDNSIKIIEKYAQIDSRIKFYMRENKGLIQTMKEAIELCSGDYIVFVESDDIIEKTYLEEKINALKKYPDAAVIFNDIIPVGDEERIEGFKKHLKKTKELINAESFDYYLLFGSNIISTFSCVMVRKDVITSIPFEFKVPKCFDWYLWNSFIQKYNFVYVDKPLTTFRLHTKSYTTKKTKESIYVALLSVCDKKYKWNLPYKIFIKYKSFVAFEKNFRKFCSVFDRFIYKCLYVQKKVKVFKV